MYNSDGYVMIDMSDVDLTKSSQNIPGIYKRVLEVIDTNKLALIVNAGNNTPMAAVVHKKLNYYKITTLLYIFTINTNDIVIVEESGEATVDVEIVPTLTEGTKIADFSIGAVEGELFAPPQQSEINDNVTAVNSTWSSSKISTELSAKADTGDLATVATSGSYTDLSNKPTIPVLTDLIDDNNTAQNTVWSSDKTAAEIAAGAGVTIDDTTTSLTKTWSSDKINTELSAKADTSDLASVATSGSYTDLTDKPTIPDTSITDITDSLGTTPTGITLVTAESAVYKQGKHIFGCLLFKSTNDLVVNTDNLLITMATAYKANRNQNFFGVTSNSQYNIANACYAYLSTSAGGSCEISIKAPTASQKYAKLMIDYVTF